MNAEEKPGLVAGLLDPGAYDHPVRDVRLLETHISWVLLTGDYAYKIKKPVDFGFLDFSTLARRLHCCREEIRLNRRFAAQIYLGLAEIRGSARQPRIGGEGPVIEYAVKMREFAQDSLLSAYATDGRLDGAIVDRLGDAVAEFHAGLAPAAADSEFGDVEQVLHWCNENIEHIAAALPADALPPAFAELEAWYRDDADWRRAIAARQREGHVRECHGDLHLRNIVMLDDQPVFFDCIEFNPELRWIDTISETAFLAMDLEAKGYPGLAWRFIGRYLENSGDYPALGLLRYYIAYRALVRAKVDALRAAQAPADDDEHRRYLSLALAHIELAARWAGQLCPGLVLMHGLSGAGKSTVAAQLVQDLGAVRLRTDIERKRLHGFAADADTGASVGGGIYGDAATAATYRRVAELAAAGIDAGYTMIADATFLRADHRCLLIDVAAQRECPAVIVDCRAPVDELRRRIAARAGDPSEATLAVLERQLRERDPLAPAERANHRPLKSAARGR